MTQSKMETQQQPSIPLDQAIIAIAIATNLAGTTESNNPQIGDAALDTVSISGISREELVAAAIEMGISKDFIDEGLRQIETAIVTNQGKLEIRESLGLSPQATQLELKDEIRIREHVDLIKETFDRIKDLIILRGFTHVGIVKDHSMYAKESMRYIQGCGDGIYFDKSPLSFERDTWPVWKQKLFPKSGYTSNESMIRSPALKELVDFARSHGLGVNFNISFGRRSCIHLSISASPRVYIDTEL